jgi:hypothetical protein
MGNTPSINESNREWQKFRRQEIVELICTRAIFEKRALTNEEEHFVNKVWLFDLMLTNQRKARDYPRI